MVQPKGNAEVGTLFSNELGQLVLAKLNERFRGNTDIEDTHEYEKGEPISFSNTPRALAINQILSEETNNQISVLSPFEVVQYWNSILYKPLKYADLTYADTNSVSVFPNQGRNEDLRLRVLKLIGKEPSKLEVPLMVQGLGIDLANNNHGFTFIETPYIKVVEAPFLQKDQRVKYDPETKTLVSTGGKPGVYIWTPDDQSGLCRVYRSGSSNIDFRNDDLLDWNSYGRVQVIYYLKGRA